MENLKVAYKEKYNQYSVVFNSGQITNINLSDNSNINTTNNLVPSDLLSGDISNHTNVHIGAIFPDIIPLIDRRSRRQTLIVGK